MHLPSTRITLCFLAFLVVGCEPQDGAKSGNSTQPEQRAPAIRSDKEESDSARVTTIRRATITSTGINLGSNPPGTVPVATSEENFREFMSEMTTGGGIEMVLDGRVFLVPPATSVEIQGRGRNYDYYTKIRVLSGDRQGQHGWVLSDWVK